MDDGPTPDPSSETLGLERIGAVLKVTVDHPGSPYNTVDDALHHDLARLFNALRGEHHARATTCSNLLYYEDRALNSAGARGEEWLVTE